MTTARDRLEEWVWLRRCWAWVVAGWVLWVAAVTLLAAGFPVVSVGFSAAACVAFGVPIFGVRP